jgi:colanic acid biosynthesis glycosyl transferase WcaI
VVPPDGQAPPTAAPQAPPSLRREPVRGRHAVPAAPAPDAAGDPLRTAHVLVVGIHYPPEPIGVAPHTAGVAEHLARRAASVTVVSGQPHYPAWAVDPRYRGHHRLVESPPDGAGPTVVRLSHHVPSHRRAHRTTSGARYELSFARRVVSARLPHRPDVVVGVTPNPGGAAAAALLARRSAVPLVLVVHDLVPPTDDSRLAARLERYALQRADRVAVTRPELVPAVAAQGVPRDRIGVVPAWAEPATCPDRDAARDRLGWSRDCFVVAHTGAMGLREDLNAVVEAARHLPPDVRIVLLGDGSQRGAVHGAAAGTPAVSVAETEDDEHRQLVLAASDVLLLHERPDAGGLRLPDELVRYLGAGRPVLAAVAVDGITARRLRRAAGAGLVVRPSDPVLLAGAVLRLRADPQMRRTMARRAAEYAETSLGRAASMAALDDLLAGLPRATG